ncbi:ABC transporter ATP-binding protein [Rhizomonospora bruguierae]|uniref:ABC transporter ATP-binding protein n=1 Tax=Rhizomonospora bruguierae TaxID=1581705 RepID=UPI001BCB4443|nr:ABC transporter ATP-binding protein [Micromonospora sp. NBRC 107566]
MTHVVLRLEHVTKLFGATAAVDGVDFEVRQGEILTMLGSSGCGKSTTLRLVMGLERADSGRITYEDRVLDSDKIFVPTHKRDMGLVFQNYAVWPHMTVFENIAYPLRVRRVPKPQIESAVTGVIDNVGLAKMRDRPATMLSGGQQQRVALARALVFEPRLLLMDEPFSNLDAKLREQMRAEVRSLQKRLGLTILFVTHDQQEALALSDRIVLMDGGRVVEISDPTTMYRQPTTKVARDFIGQSLRLTGRVASVDHDGEVVVELPSGERVRGHQAVAGDPLAVGGQAEVSIRPEHVTARVTGDAGSCRNPLRARLSTVLFHGDKYVLEVHTSWGYRLFVNGDEGKEWLEGSDIDLELPVSRCRVWPSADNGGRPASHHSD